MKFYSTTGFFMTSFSIIFSIPDIFPDRHPILWGKSYHIISEIYCIFWHIIQAHLTTFEQMRLSLEHWRLGLMTMSDMSLYVMARTENVSCVICYRRLPSRNRRALSELPYLRLKQIVWGPFSRKERERTTSLKTVIAPSQTRFTRRWSRRGIGKRGQMDIHHLVVQILDYFTFRYFCTI